jgi:hypothetical protein
MQIAVQEYNWALESLKTLGWPKYPDDERLNNR